MSWHPLAHILINHRLIMGLELIPQGPTINHRLILEQFDETNLQLYMSLIKESDQTALKNSRYLAPLSFTQCRPPKCQRKRNIIWFNPPYSKNVKTNIGKIFIKLINKHFLRSSDLHKIFDRNTLKLSYSCMENMAQIIRKHNKSIINPKRVPATAERNVIAPSAKIALPAVSFTKPSPRPQTMKKRSTWD